MTENFHRLMSDIKPQIQEVQGTSRRINVKQTKQAKKPYTQIYNFQTTESKREKKF